MMMIKGGKFFFMKLPAGNLSVQSMLSRLFESSFLKCIKMTAGEDKKKTINRPRVNRNRRLKTKRPRFPFMFFQSISEGSVALVITKTASRYFRLSSQSFRSSNLLTADFDLSLVSLKQQYHSLKLFQKWIQYCLKLGLKWF